MKRTHKIFAGLIVAAGVSGFAIAQTAPQAQGGWNCNGMGPGKMGRHAAMKFDPAGRAAQRLGYLKSQLKLTAEQEPLWQAFAEKAQAEAGQGMRAWRDQAAADTNLTAPDRMAKMQKLMQEHVDAMAGVHENFNRLYAALTPEQKRVADQFAAQMGPGGKGGMGGRMGGRMGPGPGRMMPPPAPAAPAPQG